MTHRKDKTQYDQGFLLFSCQRPPECIVRRLLLRSFQPHVFVSPRRPIEQHRPRMRLRFSVVFMVGRKSHMFVTPPPPAQPDLIARRIFPFMCEHVLHSETLRFAPQGVIQTLAKATHRPCLSVRTATDHPLPKTPVSRRPLPSSVRPNVEINVAAQTA